MTATLDAPPAAPPARLTDLLLIRLLPTASSPAPGKLREFFNKYLSQPQSVDETRALLDRARADGLVEVKPLRLTDAGRARALAALGVSELPPELKWPALESRYLTTVAAGTTGGNGKPPSAEQLAVRQLLAKFNLPAGPKSLAQVFTALVAQELGFAGETDLPRLVRRVVGRKIGTSEVLTVAQLKKNFPRVALGLRKSGAAGLRDRAVAAWVAASPDEAPPPPLPFDQLAFAATVNAAARDCPTGRFSDTAVFISHVWRYLQNEPGFPSFDLPEFKARLLDANAARLLNLGRADHVAAMDPADVAASETTHQNATFHFIRTA